MELLIWGFVIGVAVTGAIVSLWYTQKKPSYPPLDLESRKALDKWVGR